MTVRPDPLPSRSAPFVLPWLILLAAPPGAAAQERPAPDRADTVQEEWDGGSMVPCAVPLRWRLDAVDERFGLSDEEAEDAIRLAGMLWEEAVDRVLFTRDPQEGFPIRFVWDDRQEASRERMAAQAAVDRSAAEIAEVRAELEARSDEIERKRAEHERRFRAYSERVERHRDRGEEVPEELDAERRALEALADEVNRLVDRLNAETRELNRRIAEHNRASAEMQERFPPVQVQSGIYRESRRTLGGRTVWVEREIRIYQFEDRDHLVLVLAHELGHALGLGHSGVPGSVMVDAAGPRSQEGRGARLTPTDEEMLQARCPDL